MSFTNFFTSVTGKHAYTYFDIRYVFALRPNCLHFDLALKAVANPKSTLDLRATSSSSAAMSTNLLANFCRAPSCYAYQRR